MRTVAYSTLATALIVLAGCSNGASGQSTMPPAASTMSSGISASSARGGTLHELYNLDYSNGTIAVFSITKSKATQTAHFSPGKGLAQGLASDKHGRIYTTVTSSKGKPCAACVLVYSDAGKVLRTLDAPTLQSAPGAAQLTDISVDAHDNVYVSDYGQQAVYFFPRGRLPKRGPTVVVQDSNNAASVVSTPNGMNVLVSGGCGFASVRPYTRVSRGQYSPGNCFGIGTIALIGGAADNEEEVLTPVDGVPGLVSVSSPSGGASFQVPDMLGSISGVALNSDASIAYVADAHKEVVYAFARPGNSWISSTQPKLLATYKGFKNLDIIAIPQ